LSFTNDGVTMGNIAASFDSGAGVLSLSSAGATATLAQWQSALQAVSYANGSDNPNTTTRNVSFTVNDGGTSSNAITSTVSVTPDQVVSAADIAAGRLRFVPDANATGAGYATIGFKVSDGTAFSAAACTMTADITAPPTATDGKFVVVAAQSVLTNQLAALAV